MSGAILGWGLDLGKYDSTAAKLFNDYDLEDEGWDFYVYGPSHEGLALLLVRSVVHRNADDTDHSVPISITLGNNGFPVMASQPTPGETEDLIDIIEEVRPDKGAVELTLDLLLLTAD